MGCVSFTLMEKLGEQRLCDIEELSSPASMAQATCKMMGFMVFKWHLYKVQSMARVQAQGPGA